MKKVLIIFISIILTGMYTNALADDDGADGRGIRAGWQSSFFVIDGIKVFDDPLSGFYVGFFRSKNIVPLLKFQSGLQYYQVGGKSADEELKLHYLSVPLSLKLKLGPVYALGGVNGAVKLGGDYEQSILSNLPEFGLEDPVKEISVFDAGAHLGVGFKFLMVGVEARYHWGLVDIHDGMKTEFLQLGAVLFF